jgi:hypothetical protein
MTVSGPASGYQVFVLEARGSAETRIILISPETPEAEAAIRARVARVKESWGVGRPIRLDLDGSGDQGLGRERAT